tara:strand:+ start:225 stop:353 length:129 start_codon:yes stop_codon:yes gene_type:complete
MRKQFFIKKMAFTATPFFLTITIKVKKSATAVPDGLFRIQRE